MTRIFERNVPGPATHAFVIGVGDYPSAKPGKGGKDVLTTVKDLPSAADSAKLMCDWLIDNQDNLAAPLATLEVLISDPAQDTNRYLWRNEKPVESATSDNVKKAGKQWVDRLKASQGNVAFFYACGHGAVYFGQPVIFLSDLNDDAGNPWAHHNIGQTAQAFRKLNEIKAGFFFADTCQEFITKLELENPQDNSRFTPVAIPSSADRDKVWLLGAASQALFAYEANLNHNSNVRIGRFTQTLLKGLDGASARWKGNRWMVYPGGLWEDLKMLQRVYFPEWKDRPFEPSQGVTQNDLIPIIYHTDPVLPVLVLTEPEDAIAGVDLRIGMRKDGQPPWVTSREERAAEAWLTHVKGDCQTPLYALAMNGAVPFCCLFVPDQPKFDLRVTIK
ncbi:MAG: hypothetical protein ACXWNQ_07310 [Anaerolineales bacterium]